MNDELPDGVPRPLLRAANAQSRVAPGNGSAAGGHGSVAEGRRLILQRRSRFMTAAMAGLGIGLQGCDSEPGVAMSVCLSIMAAPPAQAGSSAIETEGAAASSRDRVVVEAPAEGSAIPRQTASGEPAGIESTIEPSVDAGLGAEEQ